MVFSNNLLMGAAGQGGGYEIDQSIRFNDDDAAYLYRDNDSAQTDTKKFTYSVWIKRGAITGGTNCGLLSAGSGTTSGRSDFMFTAGSATGDGSNNDSLKFDIYTGGWTQRRATAKLRDSSAWYHIVLVYDAANGTANDTLIIYQNGTRLTLDSTSGVPNNLSLINANSQRTRIGADASNTPVEFDGYMAEINMIDGQALAPTSFGETNDDGVWIPIEYTGTYGNNGFYITGETAGDLGEDFSGNNNDFTSTGLTTADQMLDTPTNNFWTLNPTDRHGSNIDISEGNLRADCTSSATGSVFAPMLPETGKWAWKITATLNMGSGAEYPVLGIVPSNNADLSGPMRSGGTGEGYGADGRFFSASAGSNSAYGATWADGDVIEVGWDADNGALSFWHEGSAQGVAVTGLTGRWKPAQDHYSTAGGDTLSDFGQSGYTPTDASYKTLCTANLPTPSITDGSAYFNPVLFTGNSGTAFSVTGVGFQPDFVWGKPRSYADNNRLMDVVRGSTKQLISNATNAEFTQAQGITSFDSDGFTVGTHNGLNTGTNTYVGWCWLADNTTGSSHEDGSINTTATSVNTTAGFSISKYTGTGANATVGHGLGVAPQMIIIKNLADADSWVVYHEDVGATKGLTLNTTAAPATASTFFNNTAPTSSVFSVGSGGRTNGSSDAMIAYCFAEIPGYSSFAGYTGNGSTDGPFVYTGFSPKYILYKRTSGGTGNFDILDTERDPINVSDAVLAADKNTAETTYSTIKIDILSNGYKIRGTQTNLNGSGSTYIYMAFADNPFGGDGVAPATAR